MKKEKPQDNPKYRLIHEAIHSGAEGVEIDGQWYPIKIYTTNSCRYINYNSICFMEQNKRSNSKYAEMALQGKHITWGIPKTGPWILFEDIKPQT